jgi:amino acid permease
MRLPDSEYGSIGNIVLERSSHHHTGTGHGSMTSNGNGDGDSAPMSSPSNHVEDMPDTFNPPYNSISRRSTQTVATFNLLSTIVGGGTLSLPYAFSKCGYMGGSILVVISICISIISLQTLCILSRKLGSSKYAEVMERAIGPIYGDLANWLIVFMLIFVVIAFMILEKDIAGNIIDYFLGYGSYGQRYKSVILIILTVFSFPVMIAKSLYALRHVSYLGTGSVFLLLIVILIKSVSVNLQNPQLFAAKSQAWPQQNSDVLYSLPIILIAFLCQFNVLGVYSNLYDPLPQRMNQVLGYSIGGSGVIYIFFGVAGYLFAYDNTMDNILNNFSPHDPSLIIARIGLLCTIICQIPMVVVPCRDSLIQLIEKYQGDSEADIQRRDQKYTAIVTVMPNSWQESERATLQRHPLPFWHIHRYSYASEIMTFVIAVLCLIMSECVPGVATIWSIAGSSISLTLAFYLPSRAYICYAYKVDSHPSWRTDFYVWFSNIMVYVSVAMIGLCTYQAIMKL